MRFEIILRGATTQRLPILDRDAVQRANPRLGAALMLLGRAAAFIFPVGGDDAILGADFRGLSLPQRRGCVRGGAAADNLAVGFLDADIADGRDDAAASLREVGADLGIRAAGEIAQLRGADGPMAAVKSVGALELALLVLAVLADCSVGASGQIARGFSADRSMAAVDTGRTGDLALLGVVLTDFRVGTSGEVAGVNSTDGARSTVEPWGAGDLAAGQTGRER